MQPKSVIKKILAQPALVGAVLAVLCGWLLWIAPFYHWWDDWCGNTSYDCLYRFGTHADTNQVAFILMDNDSHEILAQPRGALWDRKLHLELLNKLTADGARLVVFDVFFKKTNNPETDRKFAEAIRQNSNVVLAAEIAGADPAKRWQRERIVSAKVEPPLALFQEAATGWGVGMADPETGGLARRHWPFYAPGEGDIHSLGWTSAQVFGARLDVSIEKQWLRYYGEDGPGEKVSYYQALTNAPGYFRGKIVFIGNWPSRPGDLGSPEDDKFRSPFTKETHKTIGGMEIMATTFLNLVNNDWLRRLPAWSEAVLLLLTGTLIGGGLTRLKPLMALQTAAGFAFALMLASVSWSYFSNYWFPWLIIVGQVVIGFLAACATAFAEWVLQNRQVLVSPERFSGYKTIGEPFGEGSFGKVWLVRNIFDQPFALKEVEWKDSDAAAAKRANHEFRGLKSFMPISHQHRGLLRIDFVNRVEQKNYFYYVMELGDALDPAWEQKGQPYVPRDLSRACAQAGGRLPVRECLRIGIALLDALEFLHRSLVHRDIKPSNIIFVEGQPKLADVGLIRDPTTEGTVFFTPGYVASATEPLGTRAADIYAMGKVLYVISTGENPDAFPNLPTQLAEDREFMRLDEIFCKACTPVAAERYASAAEMLAALRAAQNGLDAGQTKKI